jgi:hypothetical protein
LDRIDVQRKTDRAPEIRSWRGPLLAAATANDQQEDSSIMCVWWWYRRHTGFCAIVASEMFYENDGYEY